MNLDLNAAPTRRALPYQPAKDAQRAPVAGGGEVFDGANVKTGDPHLVFEIGRQQQAIPAPALAAALYHGVISREAVQALWAQADKDKDRAK